MAAKEFEGDGGLVEPGYGGEAGTFEASVYEVFGSDFGSFGEAVKNDAVAEVGSHRADARVVGVEKGEAVCGERVDKFFLGAGDAFDAVGEELEVHGADVRDDSPSGLRDGAEGGDFAGVVHAHFDDSNLMFGFQAQQLQRDAEVVVEIAGGFENVEAGGEDFGDGFFGRGFAC